MVARPRRLTPLARYCNIRSYTASDVSRPVYREIITGKQPTYKGIRARSDMAEPLELKKPQLRN